MRMMESYFLSWMSTNLQLAPHTARLIVITCPRGLGLAGSAFGAHSAATRDAVTQLCALWSKHPPAAREVTTHTSAHWAVFLGFGDFDQAGEVAMRKRFWQSEGCECNPHPDPRHMRATAPREHEDCHQIIPVLEEVVRRNGGADAVALPVLPASWLLLETDVVTQAAQSGTLARSGCGVGSSAGDGRLWRRTR